MIKLKKEPEPAVLREHGRDWSARFIAARLSGTPIPDSLRYCYREPSIKAALLNETCEKCAYCESRVRHVSPGDIEHIRPVSKRPELIATWENLTFACQVCNRNKLDFDSDTEPLLNPYVDDPDEHLVFLGPLLMRRPGCARGLHTVETLDLNRLSLFERRKEKLQQIQDLLDSWALRPAGNTKDALKKQILALAEPCAEFSALIKTALRIWTDLLEATA